MLRRGLRTLLGKVATVVHDDAKSENPGAGAAPQGKRVLLTGTAGGQGAVAQRLLRSMGRNIAGCDVAAGCRCRDGGRAQR